MTYTVETSGSGSDFTAYVRSGEPSAGKIAASAGGFSNRSKARAWGDRKAKELADEDARLAARVPAYTGPVRILTEVNVDPFKRVIELVFDNAAGKKEDQTLRFEKEDEFVAAEELWRERILASEAYVEPDLVAEAAQRRGTTGVHGFMELHRMGEKDIT